MIKEKSQADIAHDKKGKYKTIEADHQGRLPSKYLEQSASSTSKSYKPIQKDYPNPEEFMKDVAEKAIKDLLNTKGKRTWEENANGSERVAPFTESIMSEKIPSYVKIPTMKYHGTTDPDDHLMAFDG